MENYGKDTKVHKALIKDLGSLHIITSIHQLNSIHDFYNKLSRIVRSLVTMGKLETAQSAVYTLMDKLGLAREVIAQKDGDWESWGLTALVEHLHKFVDRNPIREGETAVTKKDRKKGVNGVIVREYFLDIMKKTQTKTIHLLQFRGTYRLKKTVRVLYVK